MYINEIKLPDISINEKLPFNITVRDLLVGDTNSIVSATRYLENKPNVTGVDISSKVSISTNVIGLATIWTDIETKATGKYRINIVAKNSTDTRQVEINILIEVHN